MNASTCALSASPSPAFAAHLRLSSALRQDLSDAAAAGRPVAMKLRHEGGQGEGRGGIGRGISGEQVPVHAAPLHAQRQHAARCMHAWSNMWRPVCQGAWKKRAHGLGSVQSRFRSCISVGRIADDITHWCMLCWLLRKNKLLATNSQSLQRAPLSKPWHHSTALSGYLSLELSACTVQGSWESHQTAWACPCDVHGMKPSSVGPIPKNPGIHCDMDSRDLN
eukprot:351398-Chlamydomonas_euryale.AAC.5